MTSADLRAGARFLRGLPGFLRHPVTLAEARAALQRRLERREADFAALVRATVFDWPASPYRALFRAAGCEAGDVERLVEREGLDAALRTLLDRGVYLTGPEFRGTRDVVRGRLTYRVRPTLFRNPDAGAHIQGQSSGSRGERTPVALDLAFVRERAVDYALVADQLLPRRTAHGIWKTPGGDALDNLLCFAGFGALVDRWFLQLDPAANGLDPAYRWSIRALRAGARIAGRGFPRPQVVTLDDPSPIVRWMASSLRAGVTPHLQIFSSAAVMLCQTALSTGIDLGGAWLMVGGEPLTAARVATIRRAGASPFPRYGTAEAPSIALGCRCSDTSDDLHLLSDLYALVRPDDPAQTGPLFISSLRPTAPLILLNVSLGDQAVIEHRACGCPLEALGWTTHLHTLRSFEKLTAGGMTFLDTDLIHVLETVLPARFGGGPTDYQLVEEETAEGRPTLRLLVHPRVGVPRLDTVGDAFLDAIGAGPGPQRVMAEAWRGARLLAVEHRPPVPTASGKILHLRLAGRSSGPRSGFGGTP